MNDKPIKFLMVLNELAWFWSHRLPLAKAIQDKGWDLSVATHDAHQDKKLSALGAQGFDLPRFGSLNIIAQLQFMRVVYKVIKVQRPDIVHAITIRYAFYVGLVTRLMRYEGAVFTVAGLGSLYTAPGIKMHILRAIVLPLLRFAFGGQGKQIIFQNPDDRQKMIDTKIVLPENTALIRGSGVDIHEFAFTPYEQTTDNPIILFTSRLVREKGILDFIEAARILKKKNVQARFVVAGNIYSDNPRSLSESEIRIPHNEGVIEWLGQVEDMPDLLKRSMMVVLPSYYGEGVPKVLLEAAAIGRPIVTCDAPGCRETVEHGVNGLLVPPQSPEALAQAIEELINNPEKCRAFGQAGRKRVEEDFNTEHVVAQTMLVYEELL